MAFFEKIILSANNASLMVGVWRFGKLKFFNIFQNDEQGHEAFRHFLQRTQNTNIYFLADALEEDYRLESLPHTRGRDRNGLLERKLNQIYRGHALRTALFLKRDKEQAKSDHFLFMALNNAEFMQSWLSIVEAEQAPLAGVYLFSMVAPFLAKRLKLNIPHIILTEKLSTGLRQSYLQNGDLRLSRFVPFSNGDINPPLSFYLAETEKARLYLSTQRYLSKDTEVTIAIPSLDHAQQALCKQIEDQGQVCLSANLSPLIKSLGLDKALADKTPELIRMDLVAKSRLVTSLAMPKLTKYYRINLIRESLNLATTATLAIGLIVSSFYFQQEFSQKSEQEDLIAQTKHQQQLYEQVAKDFPITPLPSNELQLAVELNQRIKDYQRLPDRMMQIISNAMAKAPEVQINRLFWAQTNDVNLKDNDVSIALSQSQENKPPLPALSNTDLHETAFVNGEIKRFTGDYRAALNAVNQLVDRLKSDAGVAYVEILQAPVNVSSYSNLEGSTTDEVEAKQSAAIFKLKIILKREGASS
jgi:hypothetical protein